ncbi:muscle M-line assembly protein unc-89-like [Scleropages formosus]|uniref:muscle M-line assembly protein unc-89-like n=1 Tax=Scleropages formosus TaxID=113540 RepID=UPI0010FAC335|nr:muscle M-line assembly protein unc-89-like [Scleropages formosus]
MIFHGGEMGNVKTRREPQDTFLGTEDCLEHGLDSSSCFFIHTPINLSCENIKPSFTKKLKFQSVVEGCPAIFKCKIIAIPSPKILWFHNNRPIPKECRRKILSESTMDVHTSSLVIECVKDKDSGSYRVMAINTEGSAESTASLLVALKEEQYANYLNYVRQSTKIPQSTDSLAGQRTERKVRVDLRCVGSPFDKKYKGLKGLSRSKHTLMRTVYFRTSSTSRIPDKVSLETASERARSPPSMFEKSDRFNDRFSDIYCDRYTGRDRFSDRYSDRWSDRFSDTESLHGEIKTKLNILQKAVKRKKRLSVSTMSSSEFDVESVASESSYADCFERIRIKPISLPEVQHVVRPFDHGEHSFIKTSADFQNRLERITGLDMRNVESETTHVRHTFEPQSRSRAIQMMKGKLLNEHVREMGDEDVEDSALRKVEEVSEERNTQTQNECLLSDDQVISLKDTHIKLENPQPQWFEAGNLSNMLERCHLPISGSEDNTKEIIQQYEDYSVEQSQRTKQVNLFKEGLLGEVVKQEDNMKSTKPESDCKAMLKDTIYEKNLEIDVSENEDKFLTLRIRKWQEDLQLEHEAVQLDPHWTKDNSSFLKSEGPSLKKVTDRETSPEKYETSGRKSSKLKATRAAKQMPFEKGIYEQHLSRENLSGREIESAQFVSEKEALAQRIIKWQQDVLIEQEEAVDVETDWVDTYSAEASERKNELREQGETLAQNQECPVEKSAAFTSVQAETKCGLSSHDHKVDSFQTDREIKFSDDNEITLNENIYFASEKEAMTQRMIKWRHDILIEQEEAAELDSDWTAVDQSQYPTKETENLTFGVKGSVNEATQIQEKSLKLPYETLQVKDKDVVPTILTPLEDINKWKSEYLSSEDQFVAQQCGHQYQDVVALKNTSLFESDLTEGKCIVDDQGTAAKIFNKKVDEAYTNYPPVIMKQLISLEVKKGEMSEFVCHFKGDPEPTVTWFKDKQPILQNPDYDICTKKTESKLIICYPTTDHQGTYSCAITNKCGMTKSSATLIIIESPEVKKHPEVAKEVQVTTVEEMDDEHFEGMIERELELYINPKSEVKSTLQVPQLVLQRSHADSSLHSSPVEIRITAPTPILELSEDMKESFEPIEKVPDISDEDNVLQTTKHKFTFSFELSAEAPRVVKELENLICSEGQTAMLECIVIGEPVPTIMWFHDDSALTTANTKYRFEDNGKIYRLYVDNFSSLDVGTYKLVATNKLGQAESIANVLFENSKEITPAMNTSEVSSQCSVYVRATEGIDTEKDATKIMDVVNQFECPSLESVQSPFALLENMAPLQKGNNTDEFQGEGKMIHSKEATSNRGAAITGCGLQSSGAIVNISKIKQAFEPSGLPENATKCEFSEPFFSKKEMPKIVINPVEKELIQSEMKASSENIAHQIEDTNNLERATDKYHFVSLSNIKEVSQSHDLVKPEAAIPVFCKSMLEREDDDFKKCTGEKGTGKSVDGTFVKQVSSISSLEKSQDQSSEQCSEITDLTFNSELAVVKPKQSFTLTSSSLWTKEQDVETASLGQHLVFFPDGKKLKGGEKDDMKQVLGDVKECTKDQRSHLYKSADFNIKNELFHSEEYSASAEPKGNISKSFSLTDYLASEGQQLKPVSHSGNTSAKTINPQGATAGSLEVEEVTFSAVYDYYNPPLEYGRPLSPESEMSIELGSTFSDEMAEVERYYTPTSSTDNAQFPKSPESFHTPSETLGGFMTPPEYPISPLETKSTSDSSDPFFSPVKLLRSPGDQCTETRPHVLSLDEGSFFTEGPSSLDMRVLQEKVQGIPPAFLKPLTKKRLFEMETLRFCAEVFGLPSPDVKWFRNKTQLVADSRIKIERDGDNITLEIQNISKADQGEYICEASNYVGQAKSVALLMVLSQEARFMPAPPAVTHQHVIQFDVEDDDLSRSPSPQEILLEVELDENDVKEFEKQVKIVTIPEYTADNKSMIISLDVLPSIYEENTVDFITEENDDLKIAFEVTEMPPRFINPICDVETLENCNIMFECSLMGIPSPIVTWFKGDKKVPHNDNKYVHSSEGDNHFLRILKVNTGDSGIYACRAINVVGETICRATLLVLGSQMFSEKARGRELTAVSLGSAKVQPQKFDLVVGNSSAEGEQTSEIELEFEFEQETDESQKAVRLIAMTNPGVSEKGEKYVSIDLDVFAEPAKDDQIEFKAKSSETCSFQFQITEFPPKCVIPLENVTAALGTPVVLQCLVTGKPHPNAEWYKDGMLIRTSRYIIQEKAPGHFNLIITNVNQDDAGEFKCVIRNKAGFTETASLLKVF